jgi:hypothetical protein
MDPQGRPLPVEAGIPVAPATGPPSAPAVVQQPTFEPTAVNGVAAEDVDWPSLINEMAGRADAVLGTRSKKVKELLYATNHSREDVETTIDRISELSIMFVDPSKLTALADDMRRIAAAA